VPCDAIEAKKATSAAAKIWGPCYIRFAREKSPIITSEDTPFTPGKAEIFWQSDPSAGSAGSLQASSGQAVLIIACGSLVYNALVAAKELEQEKIGSIVLNCHSIKPLDEVKILELAKQCKKVVTVEEHQIAGGLGGAVAELLAKNNPMPISFVGMNDTFGESGAPKELIEKYNMGVSAIKKACL